MGVQLNTNVLICESTIVIVNRANSIFSKKILESLGAWAKNEKPGDLSQKNGAY